MRNHNNNKQLSGVGSEFEGQRSFNSKDMNRADFIRDISPLSHNQSMSQENYNKFMDKGSLANLMKPLNQDFSSKDFFSNGSSNNYGSSARFTFD